MCSVKSLNYILHDIFQIYNGRTRLQMRDEMSSVAWRINGCVFDMQSGSAEACSCYKAHNSSLIVCEIIITHLKSPGRSGLSLCAKWIIIKIKQRRHQYRKKWP